MPKLLKYVAQESMDLYYQNYKADSVDFFELEDFIRLNGDVIAATYLSFYQQEYAMLRQEKKDDVVQFDIGWLDEQLLDVEKDSRGLFATLKRSVMTFPYDRQGVGIQLVFIEEPASGISEVERTNLSQLWQLNYLPKTDKIFFLGDVNKIRFVNKGNCNIKKVRANTVPGVFPEMSVPDGIVADSIPKTVMMARQLYGNQITKQTLDQNNNKTIESEVNHATIKP